MPKPTNIPPELEQNNPEIAVRVFEGILNTARETGTRSKSPGKSKNYFEFIELVQQCLDDYQVRLDIAEDKRIRISWETPDFSQQTEVITVGLVRRVPGSFDQGAPFEGSVKNLRPILREVAQDPEHPGYCNAYLGYYHDNLVRFSCWALTNKEAIQRGLWFEQFMNKYTWYFTLSGTARVFFMEQPHDLFIDVSGKKFYGRPLDYFVRTETIEIVSQKNIEEIALDVSVGQI